MTGSNRIGYEIHCTCAFYFNTASTTHIRFKDTRISVELILKKLSQGATQEQILKSYTRLKKEDVFAALESASAPCQMKKTLMWNYDIGRREPGWHNYSGIKKKASTFTQFSN